MGRSTASKARSYAAESPRAPMAAAYRRPSGPNEDGAPTLRNLTPWRELEKKLAERLAAKKAAGELHAAPSGPSFAPYAAETEAAPTSGVRPSAEPAGSEPLSYRVYTVADLEALAQARASRVPSSPPEAARSEPSRWTEVAKSGRALAETLVRWARSPSPRPALGDVGRVPFQTFVTDLTVSLKAVPWKQLGLGAALAVGTVVALLLLVLTAAELTDDVKPSRSSLSRHVAAEATSETASQVWGAPGLPSALEPIEVIDLELDPTPPVAETATVQTQPAPKKVPPKRGKSKRRADIFVP